MKAIPCSQRFQTRHHIRRSADFARALGRKRSAGDGVLLIYGCENGFTYPRLGLSVSRKVGGAVIRNRWKRLIREAFRLQLGQLPPGVDLVVIPRPAIQPHLADVSQSLVRLAKRVAVRLAESAPRQRP